MLYKHSATEIRDYVLGKPKDSDIGVMPYIDRYFKTSVQ